MRRSPSTFASFIAALEGGASIAGASRACSITEQTGHGWIKKSRAMTPGFMVLDRRKELVPFHVAVFAAKLHAMPTPDDWLDLPSDHPPTPAAVAFDNLERQQVASGKIAPQDWHRGERAGANQQSVVDLDPVEDEDEPVEQPVELAPPHTAGAVYNGQTYQWEFPVGEQPVEVEQPVEAMPAPARERPAPVELSPLPRGQVDLSRGVVDRPDIVELRRLVAAVMLPCRRHDPQRR